MNQLEMATTQELIEELTSRPGFVGVVVRSPDENRPGVVHQLNDFIIDTPLEIETVDQILTSAYRQIVLRENVEFKDDFSC